MSFLDRLRVTAEEAILLAVKYSIIIAVVIWAYSFMNQTREMAVDGHNAAVAIKVFQQHQWLPPLNPDGSVSDKGK